MDVPKDELRVVMLGKTGAGKSSLGNTIFAENLFKAKNSANSETSECVSETKTVNGRGVTLIDTPGFFDTSIPEEEQKAEMLNCITECSPGPHAFLIVLKVERYTKQEEEVVEKICSYFSEEAFKYSFVVFTHGDQLRDGEKIKEFVNQSKSLRELVDKCGGRCHVFDNKYWNSNQQDVYRSNEFQKIHLLNTIDDMVNKRSGRHYSNEMIEAMERKIQEEEERMRQSSPNMSQNERRKEAKSNVRRVLYKILGASTGALLGAFLGVIGIVAVVAKLVTKIPISALIMAVGGAGAAGAAGAAGGAAGGAAAGGAAGGAGLAGAAVVAAKAGLAVAGAAGGIYGGCVGYAAAEDAETVVDAMTMAAAAVWNKAEDAACRAQQTFDKL